MILSNKEIQERIKDCLIMLDDYEKIRHLTKKIRFQCLKNPEHIFTKNIYKVICSRQGCPICAGVRKWTDELVDEELIKRGYKLKRMSNITSDQPVLWQCLNNADHLFYSKLSYVLSGNCKGHCRYCGKRGVHTDEMIKKLLQKNNKDIEFISRDEHNRNYNFQCKICNYIWVTKVGKDVLYGRSSCPKCSKCAKLTNDEVDKRLKERSAKTIRIGEYINYSTPIDWKCLACNHIWKESPNAILSEERDCPVCFRNSSSEIEMFTGECLKKYFDSVKPHHHIRNIEILDENDLIIRRWIEVDFKVVYNEKIYFIEYNGLHHYFPHNYGFLTDEQAKEYYRQQKIRDAWLKKYCQDNNITLVEIDCRLYPKKKHVSSFIKELSNKITRISLLG